MKKEQLAALLHGLGAIAKQTADTYRYESEKKEAKAEREKEKAEAKAERLKSEERADMRNAADIEAEERTYQRRVKEDEARYQRRRKEAADEAIADQSAKVEIEGRKAQAKAAVDQNEQMADPEFRYGEYLRGNYEPTTDQEKEDFRLRGQKRKKDAGELESPSKGEKEDFVQLYRVFIENKTKGQTFNDFLQSYREGVESYKKGGSPSVSAPGGAGGQSTILPGGATTGIPAPIQTGIPGLDIFNSQYANTGQFGNPADFEPATSAVMDSRGNWIAAPARDIQPEIASGRQPLTGQEDPEVVLDTLLQKYHSGNPMTREELQTIDRLITEVFGWQKIAPQ